MSRCKGLRSWAMLGDPVRGCGRPRTVGAPLNWAFAAVFDLPTDRAGGILESAV